MAARERCRNHDRKNRVHSELLFKEAVVLTACCSKSKPCGAGSSSGLPAGPLLWSSLSTHMICLAKHWPIGLAQWYESDPLGLWLPVVFRW